MLEVAEEELKDKLLEMEVLVEEGMVHLQMVEEFKMEPPTQVVVEAVAEIQAE